MTLECLPASSTGLAVATTQAAGYLQPKEMPFCFARFNTIETIYGFEMRRENIQWLRRITYTIESTVLGGTKVIPSLLEPSPSMVEQSMPASHSTHQRHLAAGTRLIARLGKAELARSLTLGGEFLDSSTALVCIGLTRNTTATS